MADRRFIISGGGTSGHINPALAIAARLKADLPASDIRFLGTERGLEATLVPAAGFDFTAIRASGLPGRASVAAIKAIREFLAGRQQCRRIMKQWRPDAVIGTGGYVCSPVVAAAAGLGIPVLLHEQNALPGRSNRLMARQSQAVCFSFPGSDKYFKTAAPLILTGNPVRPEFFRQDKTQARRILGMPAAAVIVLAIGGSLGAGSVNRAILGWAADLEQRKNTASSSNPLIYLGCGKQHYAQVAAAAADISCLAVSPYIDDIHHYMAAADLIICRAGAGACFELAALGKPSVLVPYPYAAGDHQTYNARYLADQKAAIICPDSQLVPAWLTEVIEPLLADNRALDQMGQAASGLARPDAAAKICQALYELLK